MAVDLCSKAVKISGWLAGWLPSKPGDWEERSMVHGWDRYILVLCVFQVYCLDLLFSYSKREREMDPGLGVK